MKNKDDIEEVLDLWDKVIKGDMKKAAKKASRKRIAMKANVLFWDVYYYIKDLKFGHNSIYEVEKKALYKRFRKDDNLYSRRQYEEDVAKRGLSYSRIGFGVGDVLMPIIRRVHPTLMAGSLIGVQPMPMPDSMSFFLPYGNNTTDRKESDDVVSPESPDFEGLDYDR